MKNFLSILLLLATGFTAAAQSTWTVSNDGNKFTISRSDIKERESIRFRTVGLSAVPGQHFDGQFGSVVFPKGQRTHEVTINEKTPGTPVYRYQNGYSRQYRFEVTNMGGDQLAYRDRTISYGEEYRVTTNTFAEKHFTFVSSETDVTHAGYTQAYHAVPLESYYANATSLDYLVPAGANLWMTLEFQAKEKNDGYQHLQILVNETENCDSGAGANNPGNINLSVYMACFAHKHGSKETNYYRYSFPLTSASNNCGVVDNAWSGLNNTVGSLRTQKFKTVNHRSSDGRLVIPTEGLSTLGVRFNASGSDSDTWTVKQVEAKLQAVDTKAPTTLDSPILPNGYRSRGNRTYICIPFSEIVKVTGTPTLSTTWGTLSYMGGDGTNALFFSGYINASEGTTFSITGFNGTVKDLSGNSFNGVIEYSSNAAVTADYDYPATLADFTQNADGSYRIATKEDLKNLSSYVNAGGNTYGLVFRQTADITNVGSMNPIGNGEKYSDNREGGYWFDDNYFRGTYDGGGYLISGVSCQRTVDNIGLFGVVTDRYLGKVMDPLPVIERIHLSDCSFSGSLYVGAIAGKNDGIIRNCYVESSVTVGAGVSRAFFHGGIAGVCYSGIIEGCVSAARITAVGITEVGGEFGGIAGLCEMDEDGQNGIKNNLYVGESIESPNNVSTRPGSIVSALRNGFLSNNYYTSSKAPRGTGYTTGNSSPHDINGACRGYTITAGPGVTITPREQATVYDVSGITAYGTEAILYNDRLYSGSSKTFHFDLSYDNTLEGYRFDGYSAAGVELEGNETDGFSVKVSGNITINALVPDYSLVWGSGDGTSENPYVISTVGGWRTLVEEVKGGKNFSGKYFRLAADIGPVTDMLGTDATEFRGNIDGAGYKVTLSLSRDVAPQGDEGLQGLALIHFAGNGCSVSNLTVDGTITTACKFAAGFISYITDGTEKSQKTISLTNCRSSVNIVSSITEDATSAGFVGVSRSYVQLSLTNCLFDGSFSSDNGTQFCGFVAYQRSAGLTTINNCISAPTSLNLPTLEGNHRNFVRYGGSSVTLSGNNYYTRSIGTSGQGTKVYSVSLAEGIRTLRSSGTAAGNDGAMLYTNGSTIAGADYYASDATVALGPQAGYTIQSVTYNDGSDHSATDNGNGRWSFIMPSSSVTVSVSATSEASVQLTAGEATLGGQTHYWTTFFHPSWNYRLPEGAQAFTMKDDKALYRVEDGRIIPAGCPVVIMADSASLTLTVTEESATPESGNILQGTLDETPTPNDAHVLSLVNGVIGFYRYSGGFIPANKAYYEE